MCWNVLNFIPSNKEMVSVTSSDTDKEGGEWNISYCHSWQNNGHFFVITTRGNSHTMRAHISRLPKDTPLKLAVVRKWARDLIEGLKCFYEKYNNVTHGCVIIDNVFVRRNTGNLLLGDPSFGKNPGTSTENLLSKAPLDRRDIIGYAICVLDIIFKMNRESNYEDLGDKESSKGQSMSLSSAAAQSMQKCIERGEVPNEVNKVQHESLRHMLWYCFTASNKSSLLTDVYNHPFLRAESNGNNSGFCELIS